MGKAFEQSLELRDKCAASPAVTASAPASPAVTASAVSAPASLAVTAS